MIISYQNKTYKVPEDIRTIDDMQAWVIWVMISPYAQGLL